jgi:hypothetical protein
MVPVVLEPMMLALLRILLATVVGLVIGGATNMSIVLAGSRLVPPPAGVDVNDPESINAHLGEYPPIQFAVPFLAHALGTLVGAMVATLVAAGRRTIPAFIVGAMFLLGGISMVVMLPNTPPWFIALDLGVAYLPMAWLGHWIVARPAA